MSTPYSPFYSYLLSINGFKNKKNDSRPTTHTLFNGVHGGVISISDKEAIRFLDEYAAQIKAIKEMSSPGAGDHLYVQEYRTPIFRFMFDLDFAQLQGPLEHEELIYSTIQGTIRKFYADEKHDDTTFDLTVTAAPDFHYADDNPTKPGWTKFGRHGILSNLNVDDDKALRLRQAIVATLEETPLLQRPAATHNLWSDVVDAAIYGPNGLRMIYSHKAKKCPDCRAKDRTATMCCAKCRGLGYVDEGRPYTPYMFIRNGRNFQGTVTKMKLNLQNTVRVTTLRVTDDTLLTPGFKVPPNLPAFLRPNVDIVNVTLATGDTVTEFKEDFQSRKRFRNFFPIPQGSIEYTTAEDYIYRHLPIAYRKVHIHQVMCNQAVNQYHVLLKGQGATYCMNIAGNHHNNTAFFVFRPDGVSQKCHCRCETTSGRKFGLCRLFESHKFPISKEAVNILFPSSATRAGKLLFDRKVEKQLSKNAYYQAVKNVVCRLGQLLKQHQTIEAKRMDENRLKTLKPGKIVQEKQPQKRRKLEKSFLGKTVPDS